MVYSFFLAFSGIELRICSKFLEGAALVSTGVMRPKLQVKALGGPCKNPAQT